jgi:hypothetical protein
MALTPHLLQEIILEDLNGPLLDKLIASAATKQGIPFDDVSYESTFENRVLTIVPVFIFKIELEHQDKNALRVLKRRSNADIEPTGSEASQLAAVASIGVLSDFTQTMTSKYVRDFYSFEDNVFAEIYAEFNSSISDIKEIVRLDKRKFVVMSNLDAAYIIDTFQNLNRK